MIDNPEYKGEWKPRQIDNPAYKGPWIHPEIDNPEYNADDAKDLGKYDFCKVGLDLWQVKSGTIFDNFLISDDPAEAKKAGEDLWAVTKDAEKKMKDEQDEEERKKAEEEAKADEEEEVKAEPAPPPPPPPAPAPAAAAPAEEEEQDEDEKLSPEELQKKIDRSAKLLIKRRDELTFAVNSMRANDLGQVSRLHQTKKLNCTCISVHGLFWCTLGLTLLPCKLSFCAKVFKDFF